MASASDTDAQSEEIRALVHDPDPGEDPDYYLPGYMLRLSVPPIKDGTAVSWSIKRNGQAVGTYHNGIEWIEYIDPTGPTDERTIHWRSDSDLTSLNLTFTVEATYTDPENNLKTLYATVSSKPINADNQSLKTSYNSHVDMLARALIQAHYLDKGRLTQWERGRYLKNEEVAGSPVYYINDSSQTWSRLADETKNFGIFAASAVRSDTYNLLPLDLKRLWEEVENSLQSPYNTQVDVNHPQFNTWVNDAITEWSYNHPQAIGGLTDGSGNPVSAAQVISAHIMKESSGTHCFNLSTAPALSTTSVKIGEPSAADGHHFTDGGLGFLQIQPYNAVNAQKNLYLPSDNINLSTKLMTGLVTQPTNPASGSGDVRARLWWALARYNGGNAVWGGAIHDPDDWRYQDGKGPGDYADAIFDDLGIPKP